MTKQKTKLNEELKEEGSEMDSLQKKGSKKMKLSDKTLLEDDNERIPQSSSDGKETTESKSNLSTFVQLSSSSNSSLNVYRGATKVIGHTSVANSNTSQYVKQFNPPTKTPPSTPQSNQLSVSASSTSKLSTLVQSDVSIRSFLNNQLDKILSMMDTSETINFQDIDGAMLNMTYEITKHKKGILNGSASKLPPATTLSERIADTVMEEQGLLHIFNVEYKLYESAMANVVCAQTRLKHANSELNVADSKMNYILKLLREKKLNILIKE